MKKYHIAIEFIEEVLGTSSANPDIHAEFIASKASDAASRQEEIDALGVDEAVEKSMTIFPKLPDGTPFMWNYQVRGFFKDACKGVQKMEPKSNSAKLRAYKKEIDLAVFVEPRRIPLAIPNGGEVGSCQRPLRASTAQGERVALANSETVPAGTRMEFDVLTKEDNKKYIDEWLAYGRLHGIGQWRNSGKGTFKVVEYREVKTWDPNMIGLV